MTEPRVEAGDRALETARKIYHEFFVGFSPRPHEIAKMAALIQSAMNAMLQPLKDACDREWKDETPEQIVAIAANAIYWRGKHRESAMNAQERELASKWIDAIQGALGNMGRVGDRHYFTFCLFLVVREAEKDGLIPTEARTEQMLDELRPKIAASKKILCERLLAERGEER